MAHASVLSLPVPAHDGFGVEVAGAKPHASVRRVGGPFGALTLGRGHYGVFLQRGHVGLVRIGLVGVLHPAWSVLAAPASPCGRARITATYSCNSCSPLHDAAECGDVELLGRLLGGGGHADGHEVSAPRGWCLLLFMTSASFTSEISCLFWPARWVETTPGFRRPAFLYARKRKLARLSPCLSCLAGASNMCSVCHGMHAILRDFLRCFPGDVWDPRARACFRPMLARACAAIGGFRASHALLSAHDVHYQAPIMPRAGDGGAAAAVGACRRE